MRARAALDWLPGELAMMGETSGLTFTPNRVQPYAPRLSATVTAAVYAPAEA